MKKVFEIVLNNSEFKTKLEYIPKPEKKNENIV